MRYWLAIFTIACTSSVDFGATAAGDACSSAFPGANGSRYVLRSSSEDSTHSFPTTAAKASSALRNVPAETLGGRTCAIFPPQPDIERRPDSKDENWSDV